MTCEQEHDETSCLVEHSRAVSAATKPVIKRVVMSIVKSGLARSKKEMDRILDLVAVYKVLMATSYYARKLVSENDFRPRFSIPCRTCSALSILCATHAADVLVDAIAGLWQPWDAARADALDRSDIALPAEAGMTLMRALDLLNTGLGDLELDQFDLEKAGKNPECRLLSELRREPLLAVNPTLRSATMEEMGSYLEWIRAWVERELDRTVARYTVTRKFTEIFDICVTYDIVDFYPPKREYLDMCNKFIDAFMDDTLRSGIVEIESAVALRGLPQSSGVSLPVSSATLAPRA